MKIIVLFLLLIASDVFADGLMCGNNTVFIGSSKAEVINKCGRPLHIQSDIWTGKETWTYITEGCYRFVNFDGNQIDSIKNGGAVK